MRRILIKTIVLAFVFVGAVVCLSIFTARGNEDLTREMSEAELPVVSFDHEGMQINQLYGNSTKMDELTVRDAITPLQEGLELSINIRTHQYEVEELAYEVRTLDTERLLENKQITEYELSEGNINAKIKLQNLVKEQEEYLFVLTINAKNSPIYYYTRISLAADSHISDALAFAVNFHEKSHDKEQSEELSKYLEPNDEEDNATLQRVTIHSRLTQVAWANFNGKKVVKPIPSIKEMGDNNNVIILEYVMASKGENGESQYYNIKEYFRVGYSEALNRMALFNYERTMNQIFRVGNDSVSGNKLQLGIRDKQVDQLTNESKTIVAFIQEGDLWIYNTNTNQLSCIFSFRGVDGINDRENLPWHDIKIIKVDKTGNTDFVVMGYMNRGSHEGKSGISLYHYDSVSNTIEEKLFISSDKAYQILKEDWGKLFYLSKDGNFYLIASGNLYKIDLAKQNAVAAVEGLMESGYSVSANGRYIAWQSGSDLNHSSTLEIMDLEDEKKHVIKAEKGEYIKPIGFIKDDFSYGVAKQSDMTGEGLNAVPFPMSKVIIIDESFQVIKEDEFGAYYVSSAYVEDNTIFLNRVTRSETGFVDGEQDTIKEHASGSENKITIESDYTEDKQTQIQLSFEAGLLDKAPHLLAPKEIVSEKLKTLELDEKAAEETYFVYAAGELVYATKSVRDAIETAERQMGIVVDREQNYIWRVGKSELAPAFDNIIPAPDNLDIAADKRCLMAIMQLENISVDKEWIKNLQGGPFEMMKEVLGEQLVLDLSGCTMEEVLYYVDNGTPILAEAENKKMVLIIGYDKFNIWVYDSEINEIQKIGKQDSINLFQNSGNHFFGYIKLEEY